MLLRYQAAAMVFKAFSMTPQTRRFYRALGNKLQLHKSLFNAACADKLQWTIEGWRKYRGAAPGRPWCALEVGTGWAHAGGLFLAALEDSELILFDVWDNRQLEVMKATFREAGKWAAGKAFLEQSRRAGAPAIFDAIANARDYDEIYRIANATYMIEPDGALRAVPDASQDLVFSLDVLEHVRAENIEAAIRDHFRVLRSGGIAMHQIGVDDHLAHYDPAASTKQFLAYGDFEWNLRFENNVQYFNRVSCDRYRKAFAGAGFVPLAIEISQTPGDLEGLSIAEQFRDQTRESLCATGARFIYRKP
jgi:hypothetical protein